MALTQTYRVTSIVEAGNGDRVLVNFTSVDETSPEFAYSSNTTVNLSTEDASAYFPGQTYEVTFTPTAPAA